MSFPDAFSKDSVSPKFNCAVSTEYMSNIGYDYGLNLNIVMDPRYATTKKVSEYVPDIIEEVRYHTTYNFIGDKIDGYDDPIILVVLS